MHILVLEPTSPFLPLDEGGSSSADFFEADSNVTQWDWVTLYSYTLTLYISLKIFLMNYAYK